MYGNPFGVKSFAYIEQKMEEAFNEPSENPNSKTGVIDGLPPGAGLGLDCQFIDVPALAQFMFNSRKVKKLDQ